MPPSQTFEDFDRVREVIAGIVEQHVAEPPADDDADRAIDEQIVDAVGGRARRAAPQGVVDDNAADQRPAERSGRRYRPARTSEWPADPIEQGWD